MVLSRSLETHYPCLHPPGSVDLLNFTPDGDLLVVNAARCSFNKEHTTFDEKKDKKLLNYLAQHKHLLPFRHPSVTVRIVAPLFVLRQLGKHQVGFSWSEVSRRYITNEPKFYIPKGRWRTSVDDIKQGSSDYYINLEHGIVADNKLHVHYQQSLNLYKYYLDSDICNEQARMVLPQAMFTTTVTTGTLLGWHHLYQLRTDSHTQKETREYAHVIGDIMSTIFPHSWEALCEHSS
jgi:thymidylate synthase (FAD)